MNYQLTILSLALSWLLIGCNGDAPATGKNPTPLSSGEMTVVDTARYQPLYVHPLLSSDELNAQNTALGGYGKVLPPPMDRMEARLLTERPYWVMEFYHDSYGSAQQRLAGQGQWFQFNANGTFTGGHWERQTHAGAWYLVFEDEHRYLTLDSNVDRQDAKWEVQKISGERDAMGWVRAGDFGPRTPRTLQAKMIELFDKPTRKQFGQ